MELTQQHCEACKPGSPSLAPDAVKTLLKQVPAWELAGDGKEISRHFSFDSYWAGLGFVNAVAWMAQAEKHHPDMALGYKKVTVRYSTHAVGGLSMNDFICAAKADALLG